MARSPHIITGGQTGVDRAALDAAMRYGISCGGYCPQDFWAEDGKISTHYPLIALDDPDPKTRTRANVEAADGLCIIFAGAVTGGSLVALNHAKKLVKPTLLLDIENTEFEPFIERLDVWFKALPGDCINVAGPRESEWKDGYQETRRIFDGWLRSNDFSSGE